MSRQTLDDVQQGDESLPADPAMAPLFASTWMAFFFLLRDNLTTDRETNQTYF